MVVGGQTELGNGKKWDDEEVTEMRLNGQQLSTSEL